MRRFTDTRPSVDPRAGTPGAAPLARSSVTAVAVFSFHLLQVSRAARRVFFDAGLFRNVPRRIFSKAAYDFILLANFFFFLTGILKCLHTI